MRDNRLLFALFPLLLSNSVFGRIQYQPLYVSNHGTEDQGILETFSLSFAGNFDFSRTYQGIHKIVEGLSEFIDLKLIHTGVNLAFDTLASDENSVYSSSSRIDEVNPGDLFLRRSVTTLIGALLDKQECRLKSICIVGDYSQSLSFREFLTVMAEKLTPRPWKGYLEVFISASKDERNCREYTCSPESSENTA